MDVRILSEKFIFKIKNACTFFVLNVLILNKVDTTYIHTFT